mmetsp:Transcript_40771/g.79772  ORF Transcript_40771/g.79772 Transcript_40771/m.79772 type:complete len:606 (+) Transcript_40771:217-2034(+)
MEDRDVSWRTNIEMSNLVVMDHEPPPLSRSSKEALKNIETRLYREYLRKRVQNGLTYPTNQAETLHNSTLNTPTMEKLSQDHVRSQHGHSHDGNATSQINSNPTSCVKNGMVNQLGANYHMNNSQYRNFDLADSSALGSGLLTPSTLNRILTERTNSNGIHSLPNQSLRRPQDMQDTVASNHYKRLLLSIYHKLPENIDMQRNLDYVNGSRPSQFNSQSYLSSLASSQNSKTDEISSLQNQSFFHQPSTKMPSYKDSRSQPFSISEESPLSSFVDSTTLAGSLDTPPQQNQANIEIEHLISRLKTDGLSQPTRNSSTNGEDDYKNNDSTASLNKQDETHHNHQGEMNGASQGMGKSILQKKPRQGIRLVRISPYKNPPVVKPVKPSTKNSVQPSLQLSSKKRPREDHADKEDKSIVPPPQLSSEGERIPSKEVSNPITPTFNLKEALKTVESPHDKKERKWLSKYKNLLDFKEANGHCNVPQFYKKDPELGVWVMTQRTQYRYRAQGKKSHLHEAREVVLRDAGFDWGKRYVQTPWDVRLEQLINFQNEYGADASVSSIRSHDSQLATWIHNQRRHYKLFRQGKQSPMTEERIKKLEENGFRWEN